jgi:hypothetical protein
MLCAVIVYILLSHHLQIPDSIISATVVVCNLSLFNYKATDFRFLANIRIFRKKIILIRKYSRITKEMKLLKSHADLQSNNSGPNLK